MIAPAGGQACCALLGASFLASLLAISCLRPVVLPSGLLFDQREAEGQSTEAKELPAVVADATVADSGRRPARVSPQELASIKSFEDLLPFLSARQAYLPPFEEVMKRFFNITTLLGSNRKERERYLQLLGLYASQPRAPFRVTKRPEKYKVKIDCDAYNGRRLHGWRKKPAKTVVMRPFAYEIDTLEIQLYELDDYVDEFVLLESPVNHFYSLKPMLFAANEARFARFREKILYLSMDESHANAMRKQHNGSVPKGQQWYLERRMRTYINERYVAAHTLQTEKGLGEVDIDWENTWFYGGDGDDFPTAKLMAHIKHCHFSPRDEIRHWKISGPFLRMSTKFCTTFQYDNGCLSKPKGPGHICILDWTSGTPRLEKSLWHFNRCTTNFVELIKDFSIAEGGVVSGGSMAPQILAKPSLQNRWRRHGLRTCCTNTAGDWSDEKFVRRMMERQSTTLCGAMTLPWVVVENKERYPWLWPDEFPEAYSEDSPY